MALAIISCHWNPAGFRRLVSNWHVWRKSVADLGVPVVSAELTYTGQFSTDSEIQLYGGYDNVMWQKEALLNLALRSLPPEIDRVVWADADVLYTDANWLQKVDDALDENALVQCFSKVRLTNAAGKVVQELPGSVASREANWFGVHTKPGYIWAARRDVLDDGLYDKLIAGSGDVGILLAGLGQFGSRWSRRQGEAVRRHWLKWGAGFYKKVMGRVGYIDATITHLYHGTHANRRYAERDRMLAEQGYDPVRDVYKAPSGILAWNAKADAVLVEETYNYFIDRREDD